MQCPSFNSPVENEVVVFKQGTRGVGTTDIGSTAQCRPSGRIACDEGGVANDGGRLLDVHAPSQVSCPQSHGNAFDHGVPALAVDEVKCTSSLARYRVGAVDKGYVATVGGAQGDGLAAKGDVGVASAAVDAGGEVDGGAGGGGVKGGTDVGAGVGKNVATHGSRSLGEVVDDKGVARLVIDFKGGGLGDVGAVLSGDAYAVVGSIVAYESSVTCQVGGADIGVGAGDLGGVCEGACIGFFDCIPLYWEWAAARWSLEVFTEDDLLFVIFLGGG